MMTFAAFGVAVVGFTTLALSMSKHHRDLFGRDPARRAGLVLRVTGWLLLVASLSLAIVASGPSIGVVVWLGVATISAVAVAMGLTFWPGATPSVIRDASRPNRAIVRPHEESPNL